MLPQSPLQEPVMVLFEFWHSHLHPRILTFRTLPTLPTEVKNEPRYPLGFLVWRTLIFFSRQSKVVLNLLEFTFVHAEMLMHFICCFSQCFITLWQANPYLIVTVEHLTQFYPLTLTGKAANCWQFQLFFFLQPKIFLFYCRSMTSLCFCFKHPTHPPSLLWPTRTVKDHYINNQPCILTGRPG